MDRFKQAAGLLPYDLRRSVEGISPDAAERAEELRLRVGQPVSVTYPTGEMPIAGSRAVSGEDLRTVLEIASQASAHTVLEQVRHGFVSLRGGHRLGLCGTAVLRDGAVANLRALSSLSVRIAHEYSGLAGEVLPALLHEGGIAGTLILSPPGRGKTTLLRDLIRALSDGDGVAAKRVGVADERGELAALWEGVPQLNIGRHTDVMDGCPKACGLMMLLRGMNPEVLAADEITDPDDVAAIELAAGCGVTMLATAHAAGVDDLRRRPLYRALLALGVFERVVCIGMEGGARRYTVRPLQNASGVSSRPAAHNHSSKQPAVLPLGELPC